MYHPSLQVGGAQVLKDDSDEDAAKAREVQHTLVCPLQVKFHAVFLKGVINISGTL